MLYQQHSVVSDHFIYHNQLQQGIRYQDGGDCYVTLCSDAFGITHPDIQFQCMKFTIKSEPLQSFKQLDQNISILRTCNE